MKLIKDELKNKIWNDVRDKVLEHSPCGSPVRNQIRKNFGLWRWDDSLIRLKIRNPKWNIIGDLDETD